jgi:hypothetical protein
VVLGERLAPVQIVGGLVIVGGIALARSARGAKPVVDATDGLTLAGATEVQATGSSSSALAPAPSPATVAINSAGVVRD